MTTKEQYPNMLTADAAEFVIDEVNRFIADVFETEAEIDAEEAESQLKYTKKVAKVLAQRIATWCANGREESMRDEMTDDEWMGQDEKDQPILVSMDDYVKSACEAAKKAEDKAEDARNRYESAKMTWNLYMEIYPEEQRTSGNLKQTKTHAAIAKEHAEKAMRTAQAISNMYQYLLHGAAHTEEVVETQKQEG